MGRQRRPPSQIHHTDCITYDARTVERRRDTSRWFFCGQFKSCTNQLFKLTRLHSVCYVLFKNKYEIRRASLNSALAYDYREALLCLPRTAENGDCSLSSTKLSLLGRIFACVASESRDDSFEQ